MPSIFDPEHQQTSIESKIAAALERIAEAFRVMLWSENKKYALSPIQMQILIFLLYHRADQCTTTALATEFNMTKPTISDATRVLEEKGLIARERHPTDARSTVLRLTPNGRVIAQDTSNFANILSDSLFPIPQPNKEILLGSLLELIERLQNSGVISVTRMCRSCRFFSTEQPGAPLYCNLMQRPLSPQELRIDCPEFERRKVQ